MGWLDAWRGRSARGGEPGDDQVAALLRPLLETRGDWDWPAPKLETYEGGAEILAQPPEVKARLVVEAWALVAGNRQRDTVSVALKSMVGRLLRSRLPFTEGDLVGLIDGLDTRGAWNWELPAGSAVAAVERHLADHPLGPALETALRRMLARRLDWVPSAVMRRVERLVEDDDGPLHDDPWSRQVEASLESLSEEILGAWRALFRHAADITGKSRPPKTWQAKAEGYVDAIGSGAVGATLGEWIADLVPSPIEDGSQPIVEANIETLRGLLWAAAPTADRSLAAAIGRLAEVSFRKVPQVGPRSSRLGNAALLALGMVPGHHGIAELTRLDTKVRYASARRTITSTLDACAEAAGLARVDLEELAIPDYGFDLDGRRGIVVGDGEALLEVDGRDVTVRWQLAGKTTKGVPKALREAEPEAVAEVRALTRQIRATLAGQAARVEKHYLDDRSLSAVDWRLRYLEHPLIAPLTRQLFWTLEAPDGRRTVAWRDGALRDLEGDDVTRQLDADHRVRLWHPVGSAVDEVRQVRRQLIDTQITQPFKQAFREVYWLTDAERATGSYSNRFAAHILRQHQLQALAQQRGWRYDLQGQFDSHNVPSRSLDAFGLGVEFWVEPIPDHVTEAGIFRYVSTDQVCFVRHGQRLELSEVPPLAFTEALREVDLFTSVASVGNDPTWRDQGDRPDEWVGYWNDFAFGNLNATAETRRTVLEGLLPMLKIADRCSLDGRWLVVRGDLRTYRIHLRSGHIMMDPNQQYLCIVPDRGSERKTSRLYLPFEGDSVLSVILSKAFLLAEDTTIEDSTILSQIR